MVVFSEWEVHETDEASQGVGFSLTRLQFKQCVECAPKNFGLGGLLLRRDALQSRILLGSNVCLLPYEFDDRASAVLYVNIVTSFLTEGCRSGRGVQFDPAG